MDILGFFTAEHGVGEAARSTVRALEAAATRVNAINYTDTESRMSEQFRTDDKSEHEVLFLALNADHIPAAHRIMGGEFFEDVFAALADLRCHLREPDGGLRRFDLTEEGLDALELVVTPVLEQASRLGRHLPLTLRSLAPLVHQCADGVDLLGDLVLLVAFC